MYEKFTGNLTFLLFDAHVYVYMFLSEARNGWSSGTIGLMDSDFCCAENFVYSPFCVILKMYKFVHVNSFF